MVVRVEAELVRAGSEVRDICVLPVGLLERLSHVEMPLDVPINDLKSPVLAEGQVRSLILLVVQTLLLGQVGVRFPGMISCFC